MPLLTLNNIDYSVGGPLLIKDATLAIDPGERVCVVGRNGEGKSTLLKLIAGEIAPDDGRIARSEGLRIARMPQEVPRDLAGTVFDVIALGGGDTGRLLAEYHHVSHAPEVDTERLSELHEAIDAAQGWTLEARATQAVERLGLPEDTDFAALSGGMKRRVLLAQALLLSPDVLLLDEPTNHLDIEAIAWLENFLREFSGAIIFVTHDRAFLQALATRIVEIDRGRISSWPGDYQNYLRRKEERAHAEAMENALFDKKLAQEEVWIRQGIKARRTRNEGRVTALKAMRRERAARREQQGLAKLEVAEASSSGKRVLRAVDVSYAIGGRTLVRDFSTTILRGDRVGIVGPNGIGKTTLIRLLLGELTPDQGEIIVGTQLQVAYFDQYRATLREDWNALDNVAEGQEFIDIGGRRTHVLGYLQDFLFSPERARAPITRLSGGERNRLLLARLFARPSNLMILDEPTNDLDIETLELLEEQLAAYTGTVLLVSHDRAFLDAVVTSTLVLEGDGRIGDFVGGYSDWEQQRSQAVERARVAAVEKAAAPVVTTAPTTPASPRRKLSYKEQRELEQLPARIEALETEIAQRTAAMTEPGFFQRDGAVIVADQQALAERQRELEVAYGRWQELEA
ncbi:MAG: ATP-binding cassette domain-containing protein [Rhodanobacteraceae bacterium]|nr:ATP-binding cassette domain-containing protein [Xanthomonadales bacterium]MCP5473651.1 ATP-binding cassette domain-containing protein [Rhodanobacteraceae bacterium]